MNDVIAALTDLWSAAASGGTLDGVQVHDGPQVNSDPSPEWLFTGYDGAEGSEYVEGATVEQDLMTFVRGKQETVEVKCAVVVVRGDTDMAAARVRAFEILGAAETLLRNDMTLGGVVMHAWVALATYVPIQTERGAKVRIWFTVNYQAQF